MAEALLVLNAGSSSLKFSIFLQGKPPQVCARGQLEGLLTHPGFVAKDAAGNILGQKKWAAGTSLGHQGAIEYLFDWAHKEVLREHHLVGAGHRVVHGGTEFSHPVQITPEILAELETFIPLAPLHQPHNLAAIKALGRFLPQLPQVGCFDTAFHRTQPAVAQTFAIPRAWTEEGVRRYGFHGLSFEYIASVLGQYDARAAAGRTIVAHLGNGSSLCSMLAGRSIATTMGLTPLDGLVMGTRCGSIDPGVLLYLMDQHGLGARQLEKLLYYESGLLGVSGIASDMRTLLASQDPRAAEAVELFLYRLGRDLGSFAAALQGIDSLVFTGGIGENSPVIRARICASAAWLGLDFDEKANEKGGPCISAPNSRVTAWVLPTNEESMIAQDTFKVLGLNGE